MTYRICEVVCAVLFLAGTAPADEQRDQRDRDAAAALALAATARPTAVAHTVTPVAPMPRAKGEAKPGCVCGPNCTCKAGECPQKCPTVVSVPTPMPAPVVRQPQFVGYQKVCDGTQCYWVPVYR